jgi:hypothetical protein
VGASDSTVQQHTHTHTHTHHIISHKQTNETNTNTSKRNDSPIVRNVSRDFLQGSLAKQLGRIDSKRRSFPPVKLIEQRSDFLLRSLLFVDCEGHLAHDDARSCHCLAVG